MTKFLHPKAIRLAFNYQAMVEVTGDDAAERVVIMDRSSLEVFHNFVFQSSKTFKAIVPLRYATSHELLVGVLDDNRMFNTEFVDGLEADLIDGNLVNVSV